MNPEQKKEDVSIAFLVTAHSNEKQLRVLLDRLNSSFSVYVHWNKRSDNINIDSFKDLKNVTFIPRQRCYWASFSFLTVLIKLLQVAFKDGHQRFMFISAQDFPIKSNTFIQSFFNENQGWNYFNHTPFPNPAWTNSNRGLDRLQLFWENIPNRTFLCKLFRSPFYLFRWFQKRIPFLQRPIRFKAYGGTTWVCLNRKTVAFILSGIEKNPNFLKRFKYTIYPDEIYFHTVIMNSELASTVINRELTYIDWISGPENPRTLTLDDLEKLQNSDALFARKFDMSRDPDFFSKVIGMTKE